MRASLSGSKEFLSGKKAGLQKLFFFVHQNEEQESPALAAYFIERLNKKIGTALSIPKTLEAKGLS